MTAKPRNWHAVAAHHRNSAGPMGKRPDKGPTADEWLPGFAAHYDCEGLGCQSCDWTGQEPGITAT